MRENRRRIIKESKRKIVKSFTINEDVLVDLESFVNESGIQPSAVVMLALRKTHLYFFAKLLMNF